MVAVHVVLEFEKYPSVHVFGDGADSVTDRASGAASVPVPAADQPWMWSKLGPVVEDWSKHWT